MVGAVFLAFGVGCGGGGGGGGTPTVPPAPAVRVAVGDPAPSSVVLWAWPTAPGDVLFEVGTDPDLVSPVFTDTAVAGEDDHPVKVEATGLVPGTAYTWRATDALARSATGRFRMPAAPGAYTGFRLGVSGDWRGELAPYTSVRNVPARDLDAFVGLGDTIYADVPSPAVPKAQATTASEYGAKHAEVYSAHLGLDTLGAIRRSTLWLAMIDDHEVTNDFAGGAPAGSDPRFDLEGGETFLNETMLYRTGLDAFLAWNPLRDEVWTGTGDARMEGRPRLYRAVRFGEDAVVIVVDARSFRSEPLANVVDPSNTAAVDAFFRATYGLDTTLDTSGLPRTMLGGAQLALLEQDLLAAQADGIRWKFVLVPEPIQSLGPFAAADRYEGYAAERDALLRFVDEQGLTNVVFVAADIHGTLVNDLSYQIPPDVGPSGARYDLPGSFEITTGSVAYYAPFGPTVVSLAYDAGLITPAQRSLYENLGSIDQKDAVLRQAYDTEIAGPYGLDPIGLPAQKATLLEGDWARIHSYGWTEFGVDGVTGRLTVTTWGHEAYETSDLSRDPGRVLSLQPRVLQRFTVDAAP